MHINKPTGAQECDRAAASGRKGQNPGAEGQGQGAEDRRRDRGQQGDRGGQAGGGAARAGGGGRRPRHHQAKSHRHRQKAGHAAPPHHAHHGVCAAAVPEEAGGARDRSGGARVPGAQLVGVAEADGAEQLLAGPAQLSQGLDQRGDGRVDEAAARDGGLQSGDGQEGVRRRGGLVLVDRGHGNLLHH